MNRIPKPTIAETISADTASDSNNTKKLMIAVIAGNLISSNKKRDIDWCVCTAIKAVNSIERELNNE
jgi:hypothetical protein